MMCRKPNAAVVLGVALMLGACSNHARKWDVAPVPVQIETVAETQVPLSTTAVGDIGSGTAPVVDAPVSGWIARFPIAVGYAVQDQQVLAYMNRKERPPKGSAPLAVRAPGPGTVSALLVAPGQKVRAGEALIGLTGHGVRQARVPFPLSFSASLRPGLVMTLHSPLALRSSVKGVISHVVTHAKRQVVYVFISLPPRNGWASGSPVRADLVTGHRMAFVVARSAVLLQTVGAVVFVVRHGIVYKQRVHVESYWRTHAVIQGVRAGMRIVTWAASPLHAGARVIVTPSDAP